jgi:hypothetical protein
MSCAIPLIEPKQVTSKNRPKLPTKIPAFVLLVVWTISIGYMATHLKRTWVPHDEGTLGLSAERVLHGELPHRDFDDYTGGLTFVHALAFRELGISSVSMRIVLFAFFVPWVPAVFFVASRFCSPFSAGAVTLLAVAWSVPNYPGPMPSWYNLFFATFGTAALLRYIEAGTRRWLLIAGLCGGLSFLAKITAAYFVAGTLLFFVFREQCIASEQNRRPSTRARFYSATVALALVAFLALLFSMVHRIPGIAGLIYFVLPAFILIVFLLAREFAGIAGQNRERFLILINMCVPFGVGITFPLILFLIPYVRARSVHDLVAGLVGTPVRAVHFAVFPLASPIVMVSIIPFALLVVIGYESRGLGRAICGGIVALYGCAILLFASKSSLIYGLGWYSLVTLLPAMVLAGALILARSRDNHQLNFDRQQQIMLLLCVSALCSLLQFPFAASIYFLYVAPLVILCAAALFSSMPRPPRLLLAAITGFYLLFAAISITPFHLALWHVLDPRTEPLTLPRADGLRIESSDVNLYKELIPLLQSHAAGKFMYAAPDCPEVYFLSGLQSPSRHYFEFAEEPYDYVKITLNELERHNVKVVAINTEPHLSNPMSSDLQAALQQRYPSLAEVGRFQVRWRQ